MISKLLALYYRLPWTPTLEATVAGVSYWLNVNRVTVIFRIIIPQGSRFYLKKNKDLLSYIELSDEELLNNELNLVAVPFTPLKGESRINVSTTFESEPKNAIISIEVFTEGGKTAVSALQTTAGDLNPNLLKLPFLHSIDGVIQQSFGNTKTVCGWCFALNPLEIKEIQARLDETPLVCEFPISRKDVRSSYPDEEDSLKCGFEFELPPEVKEGTLTLECKLDSNTWIELEQVSLESLSVTSIKPTVEKSPSTKRVEIEHLFNVDTIFIEQQKKVKTKILGWVFLKNGIPISDVKILYRDKELLCRYGLLRADVSQEFPGQLNAQTSGFEVTMDDLSGNPSLRFMLRTKGGPWFEFDQRKPSQISTTFYTGKRISSKESGVISNVENARIGRRYGHQFLITGWCFRIDDAPIKEVRVRTGKQVFDGKIGIKRKDVFAENKDKYPNSLNSGFEIPLDDIPRNAKLKFEYKNPKSRWTVFSLEDFSKFPVSHFATQSEEKKDFNKWLNKYTSLISIGADQAQLLLNRLQYLPKISIIMPVYNTPDIYLRKAIQSVIDQQYPHWELCIADDASCETNVWDTLQEFAQADARIKVIQREQNCHICEASNSALELVTGDWCAFLDHDDAYSKDALLRTVEFMNKYPDAGLFYSDEDKLDVNDKRYDPYFKPDWNPELLEGQNFLCHLTVTKTELVRTVGGFEPGLEGSQDWDLFLKITERLKNQHVIHIPYLLYHWRAIEGSTALALEEKEYIRESSLRALKGHCKRTKSDIEILPVAHGHWRLKYGIPETPPKVSIIIPTKDQASIVETGIESILNQTIYLNYEIILVDNNSTEASTAELFERLKLKGVQILSFPHPFNFSAVNNFAANQASGEYLAFLNNDMTIINGDWLNEMISHAHKPHIGAVGAKLYFPEDCVQHAGVILGINGVAGHCFKYAARGEPGQRNRLNLTQQFSAITAACLVVKKSIFDEVNGFEEEHLGVAFNDIDLCLRIKEAGYENLWTPYAQLYHHESLSRGDDNDQSKKTRVDSEIDYMRKRWGDLLRFDPTYNPNLTLEFEDFSLAWPPRLPKE